MKEIVNRLNENHQIELAKSILESKGYKVSKRKLRESEKSFDFSKFNSCEDLFSYDEYAEILPYDEPSEKEYAKLGKFLSKALEIPTGDIVVASTMSDFDTWEPAEELCGLGKPAGAYYEADPEVLMSRDDSGSGDPYSYRLRILPDGSKYVEGIEEYFNATVYFSKDYLSK